MGYKEDVYTGKIIPDLLDDAVESSVGSGTTMTTTGRSAQEIMRSFILEASQASHVAPHVYKDVLRGVIASFGNLHYLDEDGKAKRVKAQHGNVERTIGNKYKENTIVLPLISVNQVGGESDPGKQRFDNVLIQSKWWDETEQRAKRVIKFADVPVVVSPRS